MRRLWLSAFAALGLHGLLFSIRMSWSPPALLMPQSRSVSISLVEAAMTPPPKRAPQPAVKPKRKRQPAAAPKPEVIETPVPAPAPLPAFEAPNPLEIPENETPHPADPEPGSSEQDQQQAAMIQNSVPRYDINPPPRYPSVARRRGYEGVVVLEVWVTREGRAGQVEILQSSGYAILDRRAASTVQKWLFTPALQGNEPMAMRVEVPVEFRLK